MNATRQTMIRTAKLQPDKVDLYQKLHDGIPDINLKHMREAGIVSLRIFREGLTLFMIVETDSALEVSDRVVARELEERWHRLTGDCFAEFWTDANEIFNFSGT
ncbi:L-rhamnose mutarotase [Paenibacillus albus]|uniref:L-rhamnose mutarotase n=1 Tax=Paenibacillus albus TaxID=2495582 RepID=A0A3Q8X9D0_9BACL|nr:L-rhamnose mutarotase [Paenibacillus albus]AZN43146.1 L-rhamnose mutarotase [Paenibacillus albus]